jgi:4-amino-4-deoxy-L-arabinose transferase-like glycosyltransferase
MMNEINQALPLQRKRRFALYAALLVALVLRLAVSLPRDAEAVYRAGGGGDEAWYLANGYGFASGESYGYARGISFEVKTQPGAVAYLIMVGLPQMAFHDATATRFIWIVQAVMGAGLCVFAYGITRHMTRREETGLIAAWAIALNPSFILVSSYILTETLFFFLAAGAVWLYIDKISVPGIVGRPVRPLVAYTALVGLICGAAVLTRAVFILFPLVLILHLLWRGRASWHRAMGLAGVLLLTYIAMTLTWTVFLWANYGRFVVASTQFMPAVWRGVVEADDTPQSMDAALQANCHENCSQGATTQVYTGQVSAVVQADLKGVLLRRAREWFDAVVNPYPAAELGGESLRALLLTWLRQDRSLAGLQRLVEGDNFVLKTLLYLFHYGGIVFGLIGLWRYRRRGAVTHVLVGFLLYTYGIHTVLLAIPRYIFPSQLYWWCAAAAGLWTLFARPQFTREGDNAERD